MDRRPDPACGSRAMRDRVIGAAQLFANNSEGLCAGMSSCAWCVRVVLACLCSRACARVLACQGQVPVRPALACSRAAKHPVPTGNVGPKKTRLSAGSSCEWRFQMSPVSRARFTYRLLAGFAGFRPKGRHEGITILKQAHV